jgi:hypothetical protein
LVCVIASAEVNPGSRAVMEYLLLPARKIAIEATQDI